MSTQTEMAAAMAERFQRDTAEHQMTVLHDGGLYRHLRFTDHESSFYWFEIITWPGSLAVRGDCGGFMFSRTTDMFEFFRRNGNNHGINPGYWAEKLPDGGRSVQVYSEDVLRATLAEHLAEYDEQYQEAASSFEQARAEYAALPREQRWPYGNVREPVEPKTPDEIREIVADHDEDGLLGYEDGARELLGELEKVGVVSDTFEWDLTDWDWQYLWCCHAIVSSVAQYDAAKATTPEPATALA